MALSPALRKLVSNATNKYTRSSGKRIKPKEGINRYRILVPSQADAPWVPASGQFWADLGVHWIKPEENAAPAAVVGCESVVYQRPSQIATAIEAAISSAIDEESKKLYMSWKAKTTILVNVLDRSKGSTNPDEVQILEITPTTWGNIMSTIQQYDEEGEDILDAENGMDLTITRTGKGLNTQYAVNIAPGKSAPVPAAALKNCHDLHKHIEQEFFRGEEPKALAAIAQISGVSLPRLAAGAAGGAGRTPTPALASAASAVEDAEVDLDALNEEVAEEVEVEAAPAKATKAKAAPVVEEETDDLEDILADLNDI